MRPEDEDRLSFTESIGDQLPADEVTGRIDLAGSVPLDEEKGALIELRFDSERGAWRDYTAGDAIFQWEDKDGHDPNSKAPKCEDFNEMLDKDGKSRSLYNVLMLPITSAPRTIRPPQGVDDDARATEITDFVTHVLMRPRSDGGMLTPIPDVVAQLSSALCFRRTFHELVWTQIEYQGGQKAGYKKIAYRPNSSCAVLRNEKNGDIEGFKQTFNRNGKEIIRRFTGPYQMVHLHCTARNPIEGESELEIAYWCWRAKQKLRYLWFTYLENAALPRTIVRARNDDAAKKVAKAIAAVRNSGVVAIPADWAQEIKTLDVSGKGAGEYQQAIKALDGEAAESILARFTELAGAATEGRGSYALSKDQSDLYLKLMGSFAAEPADSLTNVAIMNLVRYNYGFDAPIPTFEIGPISQEDAETSLELLKTFGNALPETTNIPTEFIMDLIMEVGRHLNMDLDKLLDAIEAKTAEIEQQSQIKLQQQMMGAFGALEAGADQIAGAMGVTPGAGIAGQMLPGPMPGSGGGEPTIQGDTLIIP